MQTLATDTARGDSIDEMTLGGPPGGAKGPKATTVGVVLAWTVAGLLIGAAGIHFAMMGEHAGVSWTHGVFFGVVGWLQVALAIAIVRRPPRWVIVAVIVVNVAILAVWVLTRTVGIAIGGDGTPEAWGTIDTVCAVLEGLAVLASVGLLVPRFARRPLSASVGLGAAAFIGLLVAAVVTFVFSPAFADGGSGVSADGHNHGGAATVSADGHNHGVGAPVATGHTHGATTLNGKPVTGVKAQDIAAENQPDQQLDPATRAALKAQLVQARDAASRYPTVADATAAGYVLAGGFAPGSGAHYIGYGGMTVGNDFRPGSPMSLIYDGTSPTSQITGLMYYSISPTAPEGFVGPNDHWHRHSNVCLKTGAGGGIDTPFPADADVTPAQCEAAHGNLMKVSGWMVHAWVVPTWESPLGVFSHDNPNVRCADGTYETDNAGFCQGT
jgi:hypothetical protein